MKFEGREMEILTGGFPEGEEPPMVVEGFRPS
jgi:hypothetical protein